MHLTKYNFSSIFKYDCISPKFTKKVMNQNMKIINRVGLLGSKHEDILEPGYLFTTNAFTKIQIWRQYDD